MKAFYEQFREDEEKISVTRQNLLFPPHFHQNAEILLLLKGEYVVTRNGELKKVTSGSVVFFDSYDVHSYEERKDISDEKAYAVIIPMQFLTLFNERRKNRRIENFVIEDKALCQKLFRICDELLTNENRNIAQAGAELFLAFLEEKLLFSTHERNADSDPLREILHYAQRRFREDISLSSAAKELGYTQSYLSKIFHRYTNSGFPSYVNGLRLNWIDGERKRTNAKISDLVFQSGFQSLQTYYRVRASLKK